MTARDRLEGYKEALKERNIPYKDEYVRIGEYRSQWGMEAVRALLDEKIDMDAIFCGNDLIAIGAIKELKNNGYKVPDDIGVMGFDDIYLSRNCRTGTDNNQAACI